MARVALAYAAGITLPLLGVSLSGALLLPLLPAALFLLWHRPWPLGALACVLVAGLLAGERSVRADARDCRLHLPERWEGELTGRFLTRPVGGGTFPFRVEAGGPGPCSGVLRASVPAGVVLRSGERFTVGATWERRAFPRPGQAEWAGRLRLAGNPRPDPGGGLSGRVLQVRGAVQERIASLWGAESAPLVEALVLARREHLDPALRDAFAQSGTAHLLAISGFHVGVIAALLTGLLRLVRIRPRRADGGAVLASWCYVLAIGAPQAAVRAAALLTLLAAARFRGRPVQPTGALGSALLLLLVVDPGWLASVGFQLSLAGTAGLVFLRAPLAARLAELVKGLRGSTALLPERGVGADLVRGGTRGVAAGVAATLPTLPLLAWHFDRISLVGVPATLLLAPVVSAAIPGVGVSLLLSTVWDPAGRFVAGGTGLVLEVASYLASGAAALPGASIWISRGGLAAALIGGGTVHLLLRHFRAGRVRPELRWIAAGGWAGALVLLLPVAVPDRGLELHLLDVGQGDALAIRSPAGRWILVDAGPRSPTFDAGARRIVPYLRRNGVRRLEVLVLTHPHLDHIGGAPAVLEGLPVRGVLDPSRPHGSRPYLEVLTAAAEAGTWWWTAREGRSFDFDGVRIRVLHPDSGTVEDPQLDDPNDLSVVLLLEWEGVSLLLTGDAPSEVERRVLPELPSLTILKVGHHGSRTSTSLELLEATRPQVAVIGVGDPNSFGHPHALVTTRLESLGTALYRSDRDGDVRFRFRRDGSFDVVTAH